VLEFALKLGSIVIEINGMESVYTSFCWELSKTPGGWGSRIVEGSEVLAITLVDWQGTYVREKEKIDSLNTTSLVIYVCPEDGSKYF
jgi:hypothetical protein